jgi:hypothetical protein
MKEGINQTRSTMRTTLPLAALLVAGVGLAITQPTATAQRGLPTPEQLRRRADEFAAAATADVHYLNASGTLVAGARCATGGLTPTERALLDAGVARNADVLESRDARLAANVVRVVFHVVHDGDRGRVDAGAVRRQYRVLKRAFRSSRFKFRLAEITYTDNTKWHRRCDKSSVWRKMTRALAVDPEKNLNVYLCSPGPYLGSAYLPGPWSGQHWDGVRVLFSSLPGGAAEPYHLGDTVVHEVGHYLGLDHTFHNGCNSPGDAVDDTPYEARPDYICEVGRDTCPGAGADPVHNFMDYGPDSCLTGFTRGQRDRMHAQVDTYRPGI